MSARGYRVSSRAWVVAATGLAVACQGNPRPTPQSLGDDVARVGGVAISQQLVTRVSRASSISPSEALEALVADALAAAAARSSGLDREAVVGWPVSVALARRVSVRASEDALAQGAPRDDELQYVRVAHAIVLRTSRVAGDRAVAVAAAIRQAVSGARSVDEFEARAKAVPHADAQILVERLDSFGADGRSGAGAGALDQTFVAAAFLLRPPDNISPVVETRFGWHVIFLAERVTPDDVSLAQRRIDLVQAVGELRARQSVEALVRAGRQTVAVDIAGAAESLMAEVGSP